MSRPDREPITIVTGLKEVGRVVFQRIRTIGKSIDIAQDPLNTIQVPHGESRQQRTAIFGSRLNGVDDSSLHYTEAELSMNSVTDEQMHALQWQLHDLEARLPESSAAYEQHKSFMNKLEAQQRKSEPVVTQKNSVDTMEISEEAQREVDTIIQQINGEDPVRHPYAFLYKKLMKVAARKNR